MIVPMTDLPVDATRALVAQYALITEITDELSPEEMTKPTRCASWTITDLLFHILGYAQRALVAFASPADDVPDVDFISYWKPFKPSNDIGLAHARYIRIGASAYASPDGLKRHWRSTSSAACRAAAACDAPAVETQGHVLSVPGFIATLATEAAIHYLDMTLELPDAPPPDPGALEITKHVLDGLLGASAPPDWDLETYILKGTGRALLTASDEAALGPSVERFPLLG